MDNQEKSDQSQKEARSNDVRSDKDIMKHLQALETDNNKLRKELEEAGAKNAKLSAKTREGMQSALDTLMKKWMDAIDTKDEKVKDDFKTGLDKLVKNSAEDNGVWQMMVSASALHSRQEHDLDTLRSENESLKKKVNGDYSDVDSRIDRKRPAENQLSREDVPVQSINIWDDFGIILP